MKKQLAKLIIGAGSSGALAFIFLYLWPYLGKLKEPFITRFDDGWIIIGLFALSSILASIYPLLRKDWWMLVGTLLIGPWIAIWILGILWSGV